ncbi:DUF6804 family protein [Paramicrobacterium agarici]|uniref:DUF6804 family protein n=1 Tax=Paramicrobacterium agarici TaxID=630514 RepID=UPI0011508ACA|nr:DUF6804 family protein [Microbacterium agarici]TQO22249.1 hypothetical protein FB385_1075 [Microbacterium agarici]
MKTNRPRVSGHSQMIRPSLLPAVLGAMALLAGLALITTDLFLYVRFAASILSLIMIVMTIQTKKWYWGLPLLAIAVMWNPAWPVQLPPQGWELASLLGSGLFITVGMLFRVREPVRGRK